jgi:23S rRNA pseudouridine2605 synthase
MEDDKTEDQSSGRAAGEVGERISKHISRAGIASRRDVERMIGEGRIALNGEILTTPVVLVKPGDRITIDGIPLPQRQRTRLFLYHKPVGLVTTEKDPEGRPTVFSALPAGLPRVVSVGRLDINTEGLLLLTNDGGLARILAHPMTGWLRRYRVRAFGQITQEQLDGLKRGIEIDGMRYGPVEAHIDREQGSNTWLTLGLREGKNREVKRIIEHFGLKVNRLIRISFGPFQLGDLAEGAVEEVRTRMLRDQLGPSLIRKANAIFEDVRDKPGSHDARRQRNRDSDRYRPPARGEEQLPRPTNEEWASGEPRAKTRVRHKATHRHSWRDSETWALRAGQRLDHRTGGKGSRPQAKHREEGRRHDPDLRTHMRGGRIADRHGRSILVERIAAETGDGRSPPRREDSRPRDRGERTSRRKTANAPVSGEAMLRRKTRREMGLGSSGRSKDWRQDDRQAGRPKPKWPQASGGRQRRSERPPHQGEGRRDDAAHSGRRSRRPNDKFGERPIRRPHNDDRLKSGPSGAVRQARDGPPGHFGRSSSSRQDKARPLGRKDNPRGFKPTGHGPSGGSSRPGAPPRGGPPRRPRL